jgi:hypothetical protein
MSKTESKTEEFLLHILNERDKLRAAAQEDANTPLPPRPSGEDRGALCTSRVETLLDEWYASRGVAMVDGLLKQSIREAETVGKAWIIPRLTELREAHRALLDALRMEEEPDYVRHGLAFEAILLLLPDLREKLQGNVVKRRPRMTVEQANERAGHLVKQMRKAFFQLSARKQAEKIGCNWGTWTKTPFYQKYKKRNAVPDRGAGSPPVVSLTSDLEAVTGEGDPNEILEQLIAEQKADSEPSPLADDPPDARPKRVRFRKRL